MSYARRFSDTNPLQAIAIERERLGHVAAALQHHAASLFHDGATVLTISKSSSVTAAVNAALDRGQSLNLIVCESRPLCEGASAAAAWAERGAQVTVITEAQIAVFASQADLVVVGADAVTPEGFSNKVSMAILHARMRWVHIYERKTAMLVSTFQSLSFPFYRWGHICWPWQLRLQACLVMF